MEEDDIYKEGNLFVIKKEIEGKMITFGSFNTLEEAIEERDELEEYGWPYLPEEPKEKPIEEDYGQYISKRDEKFVVSRVIRGKEKIFGICDTLKEAKELKYKLIENAWDDILNYEGEYSKFIYKNKKDNRFIISRQMFGKSEYFGSFLTFEDALQAREKLIEDNWGVEGKIFYYDPGEYGEYITNYNDFYRVKNSINGVNIEFGKFDTLEDAIKARDILVENNWDGTKIPDNLYSLSFFIDHRIFLSCWEVSNVIDGDLISFGFFPTQEDAEWAVKFLIENDWNISSVPFNLYSSNSFIYKHGNFFYLVRKINEKLKYFEKCTTYEEVIYQRDKYLISNWEISNDNLIEEKFDEYIYLKSDGKYYLKYEMGDKIRVFGIFDDFLEAVDARYECMKKNWQMPYIYEEKKLEEKLDTEIFFEDILNVYNSLKIRERIKLPVLNYYNLDKVLEICEGLFIDLMSEEDIMALYKLETREYKDIIWCANYLGLIQKRKKSVFLSTQGLKIFVKNEKEKYLSIVGLILENRIFYEGFKLYLEKKEIPRKNEIYAMFREKNLDIRTSSQKNRSAKIMRSWISWIISLYDSD